MDYNKFTEELSRYPKTQNDPKIIEAMYCGLGLAGEAGEAVDKIKKWHRDGKIEPTQVVLELGDALFYLTRIANVLGYTLDDIIDLNVTKLIDRRNRNVLHGSGDNR